MLKLQKSNEMTINDDKTVCSSYLDVHHYYIVSSNVRSKFYIFVIQFIL